MPDPTFFDQRHKIISFSFPPRKIISLVPSQTELLADLGLHDEVVGITKFCVHPAAWHNSKTHIGGTKNFNFDVIDRLQPDLIIGNKEENYREGIEVLEEKYPVWISDIVSLDDARVMMRSIGEITDRPSRALEIVKGVNEAFAQVKKYDNASVLYLIWKKPWMAAGSNTFIHEMLTTLGFTNSAELLPRYPVLSSEEIRELKPDFIFLSSEPYPFQEKHIDELRQLCPASNILLVDGEMFSWYGSRLLKAPAYFNQLLGMAE
ncbi:ABC transporter substrate-binding protein [Chryseolinea lacunae]|uniref:ABC transporter substrate-binding protein n=1 Tax=Chryseolinea lacunae TaxID=2801331 RepID=A0ABS1KUY2_9BACT|nr:helical backbone metal receptor [Chryseolinea lacunae]MBL0743250.1 ABC transporter substrate-binding protein [Chryseolinea lacunae]